MRGYFWGCAGLCVGRVLRAGCTGTTIGRMSTPNGTGNGRGPLTVFLNLIETVGNRLPDPITLFLGGAVLVMVLSAVGDRMGWEVEKPVAQPEMRVVMDSGTGRPVEVLSTAVRDRRQVLVTDEAGNPLRSAVREPVLDAEGGGLVIREGTETVRARSLLSGEGIRWVFDNLVKNFTGFHPLGVVLVAMLGIGVAEKVGLIGALLKAMMLVTPMKLLTPAMVFIGIMSSLAADAGYVVLPPIAAALYKTVGRSPLAGMAAVFAGVSAGFSANLVITSLDPLLSGLSEAGAQILDPGYTVVPTCNWYFMIVSTVLLTLVGWGVTHWFVEPRYSGKPPDEGGPSALTAEDRDARMIAPGEVRGMLVALAAMGVVLVGCMAFIVVPGAALYSGPEEAPKWGNAIVPMLFVCFLAPGIAYGLATGSLRSETRGVRVDTGIAMLMARTMADMGPYVVLAFFAAQFVEFFNYSNLGVMLAIQGGEFLSQQQMAPWMLIAAFIVVAMIGNLFIGSASAKFAFFAPVFVPMFMQVGISPELTQAAYRVGDSATNIITPLNPYFVVILVFMQKYCPKGGIGTLVSMMLPYTIAFWLIWTVVLIVWMQLGVPLGPQGPLEYVPSM